MENKNYNEQGEVQQDNFTQEPVQTPETPPTPSGAGGGGSMFKIGSIIVVLGILILGALYVWGYVIGNKDADTSKNAEFFDAQLDNSVADNEEVSAIDETLAELQDPVSDQLGTQGTSNNIDDIEADLNATDFGDVNLDDLGF